MLARKHGCDRTKLQQNTANVATSASTTTSARKGSNTRTRTRTGTGTSAIMTTRLYWHRPLGAAEDCRRLTVQLPVQTAKASLWALPLTLDRLLIVIQEDPGKYGRLATIEFDGTAQAWASLDNNYCHDDDDFPCWNHNKHNKNDPKHRSIWQALCQSIRARRPRALVFLGGVSDSQRSALLQKLPALRSVTLYNSTCHDATLATLHRHNQHLAQLRLLDCHTLSSANAEIVLNLIYHCTSLRSLVLDGTRFVDPSVTMRQFCLAVEESSLEEVEFDEKIQKSNEEEGDHKSNDDGDDHTNGGDGDDDDDDSNGDHDDNGNKNNVGNKSSGKNNSNLLLPKSTKEYLSVLAKLHRMRHYYHYCALRYAGGVANAGATATATPALSTHAYTFKTADSALGVVQQWWRCTHRPALGLPASL